MIERINYYRSMSGLPQVKEDSLLDAADYKHARYLVKNGNNKGDIVMVAGHPRYVPIDEDARSAHEEDPGNSWYSPEGAGVAPVSSVFWTESPQVMSSELVDQCMSSPLMALDVLDPSLSGIAIGYFCESSGCTAVMSLFEKLDPSARKELYEWPSSKYVKRRGGGRFLVPGPLKRAIVFPPLEKQVELSSYFGGDLPDPLAACGGYTPPTGFPISLQLGTAGDDVRVTAHSLTHDGAYLTHCLLESSSYQAIDERAERWMRSRLFVRGAVILIPHQPLQPGIYTASITANSKKYEWSFTVAAEAAPKARITSIK